MGTCTHSLLEAQTWLLVARSYQPRAERVDRLSRTGHRCSCNRDVRPGTIHHSKKKATTKFITKQKIRTSTRPIRKADQSILGRCVTCTDITLYTLILSRAMHNIKTIDWYSCYLSCGEKRAENLYPDAVSSMF